MHRDRGGALGDAATPVDADVARAARGRTRERIDRRRRVDRRGHVGVRHVDPHHRVDLRVASVGRESVVRSDPRRTAHEHEHQDCDPIVHPAIVRPRKATINALEAFVRGDVLRPSIAPRDARKHG